MLRKIIKIDEKKCTGCGDCIPACPEQAVRIVNGKARLVKELYCDGLGACLGSCPTGALTIEEKDVTPYDEEATVFHIKKTAPRRLAEHLKHVREHTKDRIESELRQWPIQLHLVNPNAPSFQSANLVIVADCVPFAYADFHRDFLQGKAVVIACPKLDDTKPYVAKLTRIIQAGNLKSLTIIHMEVPCCFGLRPMVEEAVRLSEKKVPVEHIVIGIKGDQK